MRLAAVDDHSGRMDGLDSGEVLGRHPRRCGFEAVCHDGAGIWIGGIGILCFDAVHGRFAAIAAWHLHQRTLQFTAKFLQRRPAHVDGIFGGLWRVVFHHPLVAPGRSAAFKASQDLVIINYRGSCRNHFINVGISPTLAAHGRRGDFSNRTTFQSLGISRETKEEDITINI